jgi:RND family efflux transporter MFP subunit
VTGLAALSALPAISATELETVAVERIETPRAQRLDGVVEAVNQSTVAAQTSGQVEEVLFDVEDYVKKGDLIVVLKDAEQQAQVAQAKASLTAARAQLQDALEEFDRIKDIYAKKLVAKKDLDKASATLKTARAQKEAAEAGLQQAEEQLGYTRITAPYTGIVTERHVQVGEVAQPGQPLMSGISLDKLRVQADVPQSLVPAIRRFDRAEVQQPGDGWFDVEKITIFPFADQTSNTFRVRLDLPEGVGGMFPGMFVKTAFVTGLREALVVPPEVVVYRSEVTGVYVSDERGRVSLRHVRLGHALPDGRMEVLSGLSEGEQVALDPLAAVVLLKEQREEKSPGDGDEH